MTNAEFQLLRQQVFTLARSELVQTGFEHPAHEDTTNLQRLARKVAEVTAIAHAENEAGVPNCTERKVIAAWCLQQFEAAA